MCACNCKTPPKAVKSDLPWVRFEPTTHLVSVTLKAYIWLPNILPLSHPVSSLVGWLRSPCLLSHMSLSAVASSFSSSSQSSPSSPYHFTIQATLMEWKLPTSGGGGGGSESEERTGLAKRIRILIDFCQSVRVHVHCTVSLWWSDKWL